MNRILATIVTALATSAFAQGFPNKPITIVVPVAPGGILDTVARMITPEMSKALGQPIIVDNKPGASGNIGATLVAKAKPDGYTLLVGYSMFHVGNPSMFKDLQWDPVKDFASVGMLVVSPHVLAVHPSVPANNLKELVALAKANPGKLNYATPGSGSVPHVGMELFKQQTGTDFTHVPYKGAGPAMQDVIAGNVQVTIATPPSLLGFVQAGKLRALAVAAKTRHPLLPDVPTAAESGYPAFELEAWLALFAPAGTPPDVIAKLTAAAKQALSSPDAIERTRATGMTMRYLTPTELDAVVKTDLAYWSKVITDAKIKAD
ncbi:ABC transporter substrate-binding protein [Betaproteobacteria bacterium GR16-43]|nr:ABC transporter substrate-binding protein [Betaproteobacteria bacterium GR16-43]